MDTVHDIVLQRGRVIDPETSLDAVCDVAVDGGIIAEVAAGPLRGALAIDATGLVVAPGFIDLHSHAQSLAGRWLQACDGVTTAFDLEAAKQPVCTHLARIRVAQGEHLRHCGLSGFHPAILPLAGSSHATIPFRGFPAAGPEDLHADSPPGKMISTPTARPAR